MALAPRPLGAAEGEGRRGPVATELGAALTAEQLAAAAGGWQQPALYPPAPLFPGEEKYLADLHQLTFGGQNAEAYWSPDGTRLLIQSTRDGYGADQIYVLDVDTLETRLVSTGRGVTTCSFWLADGRRFVYASTHLEMAGPPPRPDYSQGYVWPLHGSYDLFVGDATTGEILERVTTAPGYDAELEGVDWRRGNRMVFTSARDGDLDLYAMGLDGKRDLTRLTHEVGYDGGSFHGYSGEFIVWRRSSPRTPGEVADFRDLLARELVRPSALEIMVMRADGTHRLQVTDNGAANFGPVLSPGDNLIMYVSNVADEAGRDFDLWLHDLAADTDVKVSAYPGFDGFPMWSPDGGWVVFGSNRNGLVEGETNLFVARWVGPDPGAFSLSGGGP